jgi:hypothetical protein
MSLRLLNGDAAFGDVRGWFKIGVSHDLSLEKSSSESGSARFIYDESVFL